MINLTKADTSQDTWNLEPTRVIFHVKNMATITRNWTVKTLEPSMVILIFRARNMATKYKKFKGQNLGTNYGNFACKEYC